MKGIILAGGTGTRLLPMTAVLTKQLLPVYDRPMIFYPLNTLVKAGIKDILMIVAPEYSGSFLNLLGSMFRPFGINLSFIVQKEPRGLPDAFILAEDFLDQDSAVMILGDNIFEDDFTEHIRSFERGGRVFARRVPDPERFGVVEFDQESGRVISIEEKPAKPKSDFAIPGIYIYDNRICGIAKQLKPSERGELEIVDLHHAYLERGELDVRVIEGGYFDAGTPDALLEASNYVKQSNYKKNFHPDIEAAVSAFNAEFKSLVKWRR
ncbi:MAG TPA: sugar phosphate nucleotidyltransferase [bacterium]|nr:MAG: Glucose-1-phosphate thymidylyltransferase [Parcubacteria group bacterium ADurb.Bin192]HPN15061.1 sugar phosphate nucleotidyltransferase [bacterium]